MKDRVFYKKKFVSIKVLRKASGNKCKKEFTAKSIHDGT